MVNVLSDLGRNSTFEVSFLFFRRGTSEGSRNRQEPNNRFTERGGGYNHTRRFVLAKLHKAQLEPMRSLKQSDFEMYFKGKTKNAIEYHEACSSNDFER